jgi:hypothetical protein
LLNYAINKIYMSKDKNPSMARSLVYEWRVFYTVFNSVFSGNCYKQATFSSNESLSIGGKQSSLYKNIEPSFIFRRVIKSSLDELSPIFSFYIYKVDKKIFKNTRGKSGKYTFIWKYVAPYKRNFLVMSWILKEMRVSQGRKVRDRVLNVVSNLVLAPQKTWVFRVKKFSHNYVYRNCRFTLAENYRTVKK